MTTWKYLWGEVVRLLNDWRSVSQSVCLGIEHPCGTCDQILLPVGMLLSEICGLVRVGRLLWREDGSAICSVITQWSESRRTRNHTLLSRMRLPQPGVPGSRIYMSSLLLRLRVLIDRFVCARQKENSDVLERKWKWLSKYVVCLPQQRLEFNLLTTLMRRLAMNENRVDSCSVTPRDFTWIVLL
jgi:hypothetical protein